MDPVMTPVEVEEAMAEVRAILPDETRKPRFNPCPVCGSHVRHWYVPSGGDPGDVDPAGRCTNPTCDFEY